ncbi:hypothetical protein SAMN04487936_103245 [Halobacillus dabanensis]|uniref:Uncharacterized protein n=1 Tax=Halobacillus dabanensis TaxID=240302 RepID=A0A1I3T7J3_HALDA|nr:hypothetical protein [Halobacillus dabanensis]SFJ66462.1 hypothetical protein SAMN04487936_103245 [Halobacillus dabanensis]
MGYILPINHYQYQDYQVRTTKDERSPFAFEKVFKATLDNKLKQNEPYSQKRLKYQKLNGIHIPRTTHAVSRVSQPPHPEEGDAILSKMTGKGQNFSETV